MVGAPAFDGIGNGQAIGLQNVFKQRNGIHHLPQFTRNHNVNTCSYCCALAT